jgi:hypothetical protein
MKFIVNLLNPYNRIRELQEENIKMREELISLRDENGSLWDMLEEIKEAENDAIESLAVFSSKPIGEA